MFRPPTIQRKLPNTFVAFAALAVTNVILGLLLPANVGTMHAYHLTATQYHILLLLIDLPLSAVWFSAFYGYKTLREYAAVIGEATESEGFGRIVLGLIWLAWWLPVGTIVMLILHAIAYANSGFYAAAIIIEHYLSIAVAVVAFLLISAGTHQLAERSHRPTTSNIRSIIAACTLFGVLYGYFSLRQIIGGGPNPYHLPVWLILCTVTAPYLYAWFMGLFAVYEITRYQQKAKGLLYKQALTYIAGGMAAIIGSSIVIQVATSGTRYLTRLNLNGALLIVYLFLLVYAVGFCLVALGAKRLKKIEEV